METLLEELEKLNLLLDSIDNIDNKINSLSDDDKIHELEEQKKQILFQIEEMYLERRLKSEGLNEDLIESFASLASRKDVSSKTSPKEQENEYNLSSSYVVSNKTGETINLEYMSLTEKISTIYEHTGEIVSYQDSVIADKRDRSCQRYINYIIGRVGKKKLKEKYGDNWQEEVTNLYKKGYDSYMKYHINKAIEVVDEKNKVGATPQKNDESKGTDKVRELAMENQILTTKLAISNAEVLRLTKENKLLEERLAKSQKDHKKDMESLRGSIVEFSSQPTRFDEDVQEETVSIKR